MNKTEICQMCDNYSVDARCDHREDCKIMKVIDENTALKKAGKGIEERTF